MFINWIVNYKKSNSRGEHFEKCIHYDIFIILLSWLVMSSLFNVCLHKSVMKASYYSHSQCLNLYISTNWSRNQGYYGKQTKTETIKKKISKILQKLTFIIKFTRKHLVKLAFKMTKSKTEIKIIKTIQA